ncbi:hypothetical protein PYCC9005_004348 [Savitreella phatthalungensis]
MLSSAATRYSTLDLHDYLRPVPATVDADQDSSPGTSTEVFSKSPDRFNRRTHRLSSASTITDYSLAEDNDKGQSIPTQTQPSKMVALALTHNLQSPPSPESIADTEIDRPISTFAHEILSILNFDSGTLRAWDELRVTIDPETGSSLGLVSREGVSGSAISLPASYIRSPHILPLLGRSWMRPHLCTHDLIMHDGGDGEVHYPVHGLVVTSQLVELDRVGQWGLSGRLGMGMLEGTLTVSVPDTQTIDPLIVWLHTNDEETLYETLVELVEDQGKRGLVAFCHNVRALGACDFRIRAVVEAVVDPEYPHNE